MTRFTLLLALLGLIGAPFVSNVLPGTVVFADDDDEDSGIEIEEAPPPESADEEAERIRKKNAGLAGQGGNPNDDPNAPKVKMSLQQQINFAIKNGVKWLKGHQNKDGSWDPVHANRRYGSDEDIGKQYRDEMGPTIFALYTLAKCGVKKTDPVMKKGLKYVANQTKFMWDEIPTSGKGKRDSTKLQQPTSSNPRQMTTYEISALIMMVEAVYEGSAKLTVKSKKKRKKKRRKEKRVNPAKPPKKSKIPDEWWKSLHARCRYLTTGWVKTGGNRRTTIPGLQAKSGDNAGGWRYGQGGDADVSATQFALLGLRAASQAGYPVQHKNKEIWLGAARYIRKCQKSNGGFGYQFTGGKVTGSMTACGIGSLLICKEQMEKEEIPVPDWFGPAIKKGMDWLDQNFDATRNPGAAKHLYYYLYGIERVGDLTGRKEFNGKDWYVRGARLLVAHQSAEGWWKDPTHEFPPSDVNSTTLALLFLKRATPPTVTGTGG